MLGLLLAMTVTATFALDPATRASTGPLETKRLTEDVRSEAGTEVTSIEMSLRNDRARQVEGVLAVTLPSGAAITSFALDIGGEMREGVVVARSKARDAYESIVRRLIDPGLVEWIGEDRYRIRVFPVPAGGARRIRIRYARDLPAPRDGAMAPVVAVEAGRFVARAAAPDTGVRRMSPRRVLLVVDASRSEAGRDRARDLAFLEAYARLLGEAEVRLLVFSDAPWTPTSTAYLVREGLAPALVSAVAAIVPDGATRPGALDLRRLEAGTDAVIVLGDAAPTIGEEALEWGGAPVTHLVTAPDDPAEAARRALARPWTIARIDAPPDRVSDLSLAAGAVLEERALIVRGRVTAGPPVAIVAHLRRGREEARIDLVIDPAASRAGAVVDVRPRVTPRSSLLVLERVEDYVAWRIAPPAHLLAVYEARLAAIEARRRESGEPRGGPPATPWPTALTPEQKHAAWAERQVWWGRAFAPPEGYRYYPGTRTREVECAFFCETINGGGGADARDALPESGPLEPDLSDLSAIVARADALRAEGESALAVRALTNLVELWPSRFEVCRLLHWKLEEAGAVTLSALVARDIERRFPGEAHADPLDPTAYVLERADTDRALDLDLRIICEGANLDVIEATDEPVYVMDPPSAIGGRITATWDRHRSEYALRRARPGTYRVRVHGFAARVTVVRSFGRPDEARSVRVFVIPAPTGRDGAGFEALLVEVPR